MKKQIKSNKAGGIKSPPNSTQGPSTTYYPFTCWKIGGVIKKSQTKSLISFTDN